MLKSYCEKIKTENKDKTDKKVKKKLKVFLSTIAKPYGKGKSEKAGLRELVKKSNQEFEWFYPTDGYDDNPQYLAQTVALMK